MKSVEQEVKEAVAFGLKVSTEKGLTVTYDETPRSAQVSIAALHAREDAATCVYMLTRVMARQQTTQRWIYFVVFLLVCVAANQR